MPLRDTQQGNNIITVSSFTSREMVVLMVNTLPAMLDTWVLSLGQKDPLENEMATHSSVLA